MDSMSNPDMTCPVLTSSVLCMCLVWHTRAVLHPEIILKFSWLSLRLWVLVHLSDMSIFRPMSTPDYQASPDVWDWDAMPDPTIDELAAMTDDDRDIIAAYAVAELLAFGELY